ncbi:hypothetical protein JOF53_006302 [Crossiella equi]|uniref:Uncharacterized protein n=1 Tax=Crossiella equi TaxID=130796 RepID=A0ABS5AP07_9PSEU|nr:hypothetical protein [Crossiella equi]MBP2477430.1 hypothetical protein [Crossiella equi]
MREGEGAAEVLAEGTFAHNTGRSVAAFARPRTNAPSFRRNDNVARQVLRLLADVAAWEQVPEPRTPAFEARTAVR